MLKEIENEEAEKKFNQQQHILADAFSSLAQKSTKEKDYYDPETNSIRFQDDLTHWESDGEEYDYNHDPVYRSYHQ